jgi:hypothetical protein
MTGTSAYRITGTPLTVVVASHRSVCIVADASHIPHVISVALIRKWAPNHFKFLELSSSASQRSFKKKILPSCSLQYIYTLCAIQSWASRGHSESEQWVSQFYGTEFPVPLGFWDSRQARKLFRGNSLIYSLPLSITHARRFIQLWKTLCTSSKVSSSHIFAIGFSISSLELTSRSFKTSLNIPKAESSWYLCHVHRIGVIIAGDDSSRILLSLLIHCWRLNHPYAPQKLPTGSDGENSGSPFSNREKCNRQNIAGWICFLLVKCRTWLACVRWSKPLSLFSWFR